MEEKRKSGFATAGLVLGVIGICTSFIPIVNNLSFILALIGIVFCIIALIKKSSKKMPIAGIIICILTIVFTIQAQETLSTSINEAIDNVSNNLDDMSGNNTENILNNYLNVEIGEFEVDEDEFWTNTKLSIKLENKSNEKKSFSVKIEAVDTEGVRIDTDTVYADDLNAGQPQKVEAFTFVSSDKLDEMKNATYKIVEASMY